jgi:hypothetical protein
MLGQLIPQVFYDAIARFVPGSVLLGTCILLWPSAGSVLLDESTQLPLPVGIAWLIAAYILAVLLEGVGSVAFGRAYRRLHGRATLRTREHAVRDYALITSEFDSDSFEFPGIPLMYDAIRIKDPVVGANIVKLRAEVQLCRTLLLGWVLVLLGLAFEAVISPLHTGLGAPVLVLMVLISAVFLLLIERQGRVLWSLYNHWLLLVVPGLLTQPNSNETASSGLKRSAGTAA